MSENWYSGNAADDSSDYRGWLVVEQDIFPDPDTADQPAVDQQYNREYLRARGL